MRAPNDSSRPAKCSPDKFLCPIRGLAISFGRVKLEGFSTFFKCVFLYCCYLKTAQSDPKDRVWGHLGPCWAPLGASWRILLLFWVPLGHLVGPLWHPKIEKKLGKGCSRNFMGSQGCSEAPTGPPKGPKAHPKETKMSTKIYQNGTRGIFERKHVSLFPTIWTSIKTFVFTKLINLFLLLLFNQQRPSTYITN